MALNRGIEELPCRLGDFIEIVEKRIKEKGKVKIFEAGCGYGSTMMGFIKKFGDNVEICGLNYSKNYGNQDLMIRDSLEKGLFAEQEIKDLENLPRFVFGDASQRLPFKSNSFDFIYSIHALHYFDDKVNFLEECNRILGGEGIARFNSAFGIVGVHYPRKKTPRKYPEFWEIWDNGEEVRIWDYCDRVKGVKFVGKPTEYRERGDYRPEYLEIKKQQKLDFGLKLVASIDFNYLWQGWNGVKSIYTTQLKFEPQWKKNNH